MTGIRTAEKEACAIPLCLPNNYVWNPRMGKCIKTGPERNSLQVVDEALEKLWDVKGEQAYHSWFYLLFKTTRGLVAVHQYNQEYVVCLHGLFAEI